MIAERACDDGETPARLFSCLPVRSSSCSEPTTTATETVGQFSDLPNRLTRCRFVVPFPVPDRTGLTVVASQAKKTPVETDYTKTSTPLNRVPSFLRIRQ